MQKYQKMKKNGQLEYTGINDVIKKLEIRKINIDS